MEKEFTKELHRERHFLVSQQMLLETTSPRDQTKISKDFVLCWMEQTKMMNKLISADLLTLMPWIM